MTIKFMISVGKEQSEKIKVEVQSRIRGEFQKGEDYFLTPGQCQEFTIHPNQSIQIFDPKGD